jgi:aflatoxin B1 aldehyde reductase
MLVLFQSDGRTAIDTARVYGGSSSEEYLGSLKWRDRGLAVHTKLYPSIVAGGPMSHSAAFLCKYLLESLAALQVDKVHLWYLMRRIAAPRTRKRSALLTSFMRRVISRV